MPRQQAVITLAEATAVLRRALAEAEHLQVAAAVVVTDAAGEPVASARMDGVPGLVAAAARGKALTAAALGMPTLLWEERGRAEPSFAAAVGTVPGFTPLGGGEPVRAAEVVIGAVGVSGGTAEQDAAIARAAAEVTQ
ncbi:heme-binding protein [Nocardioides sp. LHD-245]|uniref:GlcG/HbpS family heme-binding protein n=1 Tax=Nocardioides sp. LHD-245 TaxID=3051387 RepID=UPI0027E04D25|nr:heme-binding protein [Nocardioides sp. LHD-245]